MQLLLGCLCHPQYCLLATSLELIVIAWYWSPLHYAIVSHQSHTPAESSVTPSNQENITIIAHAPSLHSDSAIPQEGHHSLSESARMMHLENSIAQLSAMLKAITTQPFAPALSSSWTTKSPYTLWCHIP